MQPLFKMCALSFLIAGLTACGGDDDNNTPKPANSSASSVSSAAPASSSLAPQSSSSSSVVASEKALTATEYSAFTVAEIENCGVNISAREKTFPIFADYDTGAQNQTFASTNTSGWNHTTNGSTTEWVNLKHPGSTYNFGTTAAVNESCNNVDTMNVVLVKKIADWDRQHANGFERNILAHGYKFGDIQNLVIDLKVNSAKTSVPSVEALKTTYAPYVNAATVEALDEGKVNIDFTLHDGANLYGKTIIQLDQTSLSDKWVRVTVPLNKFTLYEEINYNRTNKTVEDVSNTVISRILVVGETKKGAVLRGNIANWSANVPETFKEMDISIKKIEFQLK